MQLWKTHKGKSPRKLICRHTQEFLDVAKNVTTAQTDMENENPEKKLNGKKRRWKNNKNNKKTKKKQKKIISKNNKVHPKPL